MQKTVTFLISLVTVFYFSGVQPAAASLSAQLGATKMDALDNLVSCQKQSTGYREGLIADRLELKLANTPNITPEHRGIWLAEINALRRAQQTKSAFVPPDPSDPQRHLRGLNSDEDMAINSMNIRHVEEVRFQCELAHGGMSRYSEHVGPEKEQRYRDERRARIDRLQVTQIDTVPAGPLPGPEPKTREQIRQERKAGREAMVADTRQKAAACMEAAKGVRLQLVADALQRKLDSMPGLSGAERREFEEDIQAARASAAKGLSMIEPVDPKNPYRANSRLTPQEQIEINTLSMQQQGEMMRSCLSAGVPQF